jgi:thiol-disulfide isomerase/thioredoxin
VGPEGFGQPVVEARHPARAGRGARRVVEERIPVNEQQQQVKVEEKKGVGRFLIPALAALVLLGLVFQAIVEGQRKNRGESAPGKPAPGFVLARYSGGNVKLDELRGKVVMLDFWATWCAPCVEEMPHLIKLAKEFESKGVVLIAANSDDEDVARYEVQRFIQNKVPGLDPYVAFADYETSRAYSISVLPTLVFINRDGEIHQTYVGYAPEDVLRERIEEVLDE